MRRAARVDASQEQIVSALKAAGATVLPIGLPVDLLVGYRSVTYLFEVKTPNTAYGKKGANGNQREFIQLWRGAPVHLVYTADDALRAIGAIA